MMELLSIPLDRKISSGIYKNAYDMDRERSTARPLTYMGTSGKSYQTSIYNLRHLNSFVNQGSFALMRAVLIFTAHVIQTQGHTNN